MRIAVLRGASFQSFEQGSADAAKSRIWRNVVQRDLAVVPDRADGEDRFTLDGNQHRSVGVGKPRREMLWRLVAEPTPQDFRIVAMIGNAEFGDRRAHHLT